MKKLKNYLQSEPYGKCSVFVLFTVTGLYLIYASLHHLPSIMGWLWHFIRNLCSAFSPLFCGFILAYLLSPVVDRVEKKLPRVLAILATFGGIFFSFFVLFYSMAMLVLGQFSFYTPSDLVHRLVTYFSEYEQTFASLLERLPGTLLSQGIDNTLNGILKPIADRLNAAAAVDMAKAIGSHIVNFVLGIVVAFYLLKDQDFFIRLWRKILHLFLPLKQSAKVSETLRDVDGVFSRFLRGQLLDGLIVAVLSSVALSLIQLEFAVFVGIFAGLCNIIPYFGPVLGMIPAAVIGASTDGLKEALMAVLVLFLIQQTDSTVISPKVVGSSIGLHRFFVLLSVSVGGYYFGIVGMLLAVPAAGIMKLFLMRFIEGLE